MLLQELIQQQQQQYLAVQEQIEQLQEQQRQIQAFMQQLGSVESQMESAVQLVQEAVSSINETCPDELSKFQETVVGLFGTPIAALPATSATVEETEAVVETKAVEVVEETKMFEQQGSLEEIAEMQEELLNQVYSLSYKKARSLCVRLGLKGTGSSSAIQSKLEKHIRNFNTMVEINKFLSSFSDLLPGIG